MSDTISRRDAFNVLDNCRFASENEKKYAYSLMEQVASADVKDTNVLSNDTISRQAAIGLEYIVKNINGVDYVMLSEVQMKLRKMPSAQPERKTGWWIERNPQNSPDCRLIECSECGNAYIVGYDIDYDDWIDGRDFCMRCGADLRGGEQ